MQRLANSPVGPLLMFFGLPAMLVAGLLQVDWQNGAPHLIIDPGKASEIGQAVQGGLENLPGHAAIEHWQQTARDTWNAHLQNVPQQDYPTNRNQSLPTAPGHYSDGSHGGWPAPISPPYAASTPQSGMVNPYTNAPFPSTKRPGYVSTTSKQPTARQTWGAQPQRSSPQQQAAEQYLPQYLPQQYLPERQYQQPVPAQLPW